MTINPLKLLFGSPVVVGLLMWIIAPAQACTCQPLNVKDAKELADIVFVGKVDNITYIDSDQEWEPRILVEFTVDRVWKGNVNDKFTMHTNYESSSCGGFFRDVLQTGKELVVYGYGRPAKGWKANQPDGAPNAMSYTVRESTIPTKRPELLAAVPDDRLVYTTDICTRTKPLAEAEEDIKKLGKPTAPDTASTQ